MDKREAQQLLDEFLAALRERFTYGDWEKLVGETEVVERQGPSGVAYQMEWNVFWDKGPGGNLRILVSIDDGSLVRSMVPLNASFLVSPGG